MILSAGDGCCNGKWYRNGTSNNSGFGCISWCVNSEWSWCLSLWKYCEGDHSHKDCCGGWWRKQAQVVMIEFGVCVSGGLLLDWRNFLSYWNNIIMWVCCMVYNTYFHINREPCLLTSMSIQFWRVQKTFWRNWHILIKIGHFSSMRRWYNCSLFPVWKKLAIWHRWYHSKRKAHNCRFYPSRKSGH